MAEQEKNLGDSVAYFGSFQLDLGKIRLWRGSQEVKLTGKAFAVLRYLVEHPGQLVTKDELFSAVWPETIVSEATLASCIQEIRQALRDKAKAPRYIETVHRRGYRFIAPLSTPQPVQGSTFKVPSQEEVASGEESQNANGKEQKPVLSAVEGAKSENGLESSGQGLELAGPSLESRVQSLESNGQDLASNGQSLEAKTSSTPLDGVQTLDPRLSDPGRQMPDTALPRRFRWWQGLLLVIVVVLGGALAVKWRLVRLVVASYVPPPIPESAPLPLPDQPSLVVTPFVNLSGDAAQEYFSDGLTDDLINTLAQFPDLFIVARHSAFFYKGKTIKEQDIGRELGVRYVLEGSVRRADGQVRLNVQLVDAATGKQLWAERYDRPFTAIFALQDELVHKIATTLTLQLSAWTHGFSARKTTENVEAYDYELRGLEQWLGLTPKDNLRAREFFEKAVGLDPQYATAYSLIGITYYTEWVMKWSTDPQALERAVEYGQKAVALNDFYFGHLVMALAYTQQAQIDRALFEVERGITLQPNLAESYDVQAEVLMWAGRPQEALPSIQHALRLSPHGPVNYFSILGWAYQSTEQYAESIVAYKRALALNPLYMPAYPMQALNYTNQWITQQSDDPRLLDQAYDAAQNGVALYGNSSWVHTALGTVYLLQKRYDDAIVELERTAILDGNSVCDHMQWAYGLSLVGRVEEAVRVGERALSLKALPADDRCLYGVATAYMLAGRLDEAAALSRRQLQRFPNFLMSHLRLADVYSQLGRDAEARAEIAEVLRINPQFSLEVHKQRVPIKDPAMLERHIAALRKAGLK